MLIGPRITLKQNYVWIHLRAHTHRSSSLSHTHTLCYSVLSLRLFVITCLIPLLQLLSNSPWDGPAEKKMNTTSQFIYPHSVKRLHSNNVNNNWTLFFS